MAGLWLNSVQPGHTDVAGNVDCLTDADESYCVHAVIRGCWSPQPENKDAMKIVELFWSYQNSLHLNATPSTPHSNAEPCASPSFRVQLDAIAFPMFVQLFLDKTHCVG